MRASSCFPKLPIAAAVVCFFLLVSAAIFVSCDARRQRVLGPGGISSSLSLSLSRSRSVSLPFPRSMPSFLLPFVDAFASCFRSDVRSRVLTSVAFVLSFFLSVRFLFFFFVY
jgi:hypothetical protein